MDEREKPTELSRAERLTREIFGEKGPPVTPTDEALFNAIFGEPVEVVDAKEEPVTFPDELRASIREATDRVLASLDLREGLVLRLRYGLEDRHARTLREVGQDPRINRSPSTVGRIEHRALNKLRHPQPSS